MRAISRRRPVRDDHRPFGKHRTPSVVHSSRGVVERAGQVLRLGRMTGIFAEKCWEPVNAVGSGVPSTLVGSELAGLVHTGSHKVQEAAQCFRS